MQINFSKGNIDIWNNLINKELPMGMYSIYKIIIPYIEKVIVESIGQDKFTKEEGDISFTTNKDKTFSGIVCTLVYNIPSFKVDYVDPSAVKADENFFNENLKKLKNVKFAPTKIDIKTGSLILSFELALGGM